MQLVRVWLVVLVGCRWIGVVLLMASRDQFGDAGCVASHAVDLFG